MLAQEILSRIPFLSGLDLAVSEEDGGARVRMPFQQEVTNHAGILHAGALFTAAETAAGITAFRIVPGGRALVLLRSAEVFYTRRVEGEVKCTAGIAPEVRTDVRDRFAAAGRADVTVETTVVDTEGETVFKGTFDYALRERQP